MACIEAHGTPLSDDDDVKEKISFIIHADSKMKTLSFQTVTVSNLSSDCKNQRMFVNFKVQKKSCNTDDKCAYSDTIIWNQLIDMKLPSKNKDDVVIVELTRKEGHLVKGTTSLSLKDLKFDEKTFCSLILDRNDNVHPTRLGELICSIYPSERDVKITITKAKNLRYMKKYSVQARMLHSEGTKEKETTPVQSPTWNEDVTFADGDFRKHELRLIVIGYNKEEREVLGQVDINIADVKRRVFGRILSLEKSREATLRFSTEVSRAGVLMITNVRLVNMTTPPHNTRVYVQVKQIHKDQVLDKQRTSKKRFRENVFFPGREFSYNLDCQDNAGRFAVYRFTIKTPKHFFTWNKPILGKVEVGPLSTGRWYQAILKERDQLKHHSCQIQPF